MLIRKIFVGFFILLFCFQLAPVDQIGSVLFSKQIIEEIPQGQESEQIRYPEDSIKNFVSAPFLFFQYDLSQDALLFEKAIKVRIITRTSDDIQTPPPNMIG
jgi:hypothetical protein